MSHAVVRGTPSQAQMYLDKVLDAVIEGDGQMERREVNVAQVLYYSMRRNPAGVFMIDGSTGETVTNMQLLMNSVPLARAIISKDMKGKTVLFLMRNHKYMAALYYGVLFAGVVAILLEPNATVYELQHFISLVEPCAVFCDPERYDDTNKAVQHSNVDLQVVVVEDTGIQSFIKGQSKDLESFLVSDVPAESPALMLPTSGSTGLPKAAILTHKGLVAQIPAIWTHYNNFPQPTKLAMLLSTEQWMTHSILFTTCPVYHVTLLLTPKKSTTEHVLEMIENYKPTWTLLSPQFIALVAARASTHQLLSLQTVIACGAPTLPEVEAIVKEKLPKSTNFYNCYGLTEMQSFTTMSDPSTPSGSNGKMLNIFDYKIVDDNGEEADVKQSGELYIKSNICLIKGYYKNEAAFRECLTLDGWLKTGDVFYRDSNEHMYFVKKKKFWFKYLNYHVSPEEVEYVIGSLPGVQECVVTNSEAGPAAVVIPTPDSRLSRELIHDAVQCTNRAGANRLLLDSNQNYATLISFLFEASLSDYKKLRGGIAFVETMPHLSNGKINRIKCNELVQELIALGQCH